MYFTIKLPESCYGDFIESINPKIDNEAKIKRNLSPLFYYAYQAVQDNKQIGGIFGFDNFGALHIEGLWVEPEYRGQGVGGKLVEMAEKLAYERACKCVVLFTMDFQAHEFYLHLGYQEEFVRDAYHENSKAIYLIKKL